MSEDFTIERYTPVLSEDWNKFVAISKNGTFLLDRRYMDYHSDRFDDMSLIIRNSKGRIVALLPGNYSGSTYYSHQGLTYGGLITDEDMTAEACLNIFFQIRDYLSGNGIVELIYKPIPHIYHRQPAEEDLYSLFRLKASVISRGASISIQLKDPIAWKRLRKRSLRKAFEFGLTMIESREFLPFYNILYDNLTRLYNVKPVHSLNELILLHDSFPENIKLYICKEGEEIVGGTFLYLCGEVVHLQYMHASPYGKEHGAIDFMVNYFFEAFREKYSYIDFGVSTEFNGWYLNPSLIHLKEGFGGRTTIYDTYSVPISKTCSVDLTEFDIDFEIKSSEWLNDEELLHLINAPKFNKASQDSWLAFWKSNPEKCIVKGVLIDGTLAGACGIKNIHNNNEGNKVGEYWGYIGERTHRGHGAGKLMLEKVIDVARMHGIDKLILKVMSFNTQARALYRQFGFREISGIDEILMERILD